MRRARLGGQRGDKVGNDVDFEMDTRGVNGVEQCGEKVFGKGKAAGVVVVEMGTA